MGPLIKYAKVCNTVKLLMYISLRHNCAHHNRQRRVQRYKTVYKQRFGRKSPQLFEPFAWEIPHEPFSWVLATAQCQKWWTIHLASTMWFMYCLIKQVGVRGGPNQQTHHGSYFVSSQWLVLAMRMMVVRLFGTQLRCSIPFYFQKTLKQKRLAIHGLGDQLDGRARWYRQRGTG